MKNAYELRAHFGTIGDWNTSISREEFEQLFHKTAEKVTFRCIPGLTVTTDQFLICDDCRYNIVSVEDVKGRGMYIEVLAKKEVPTVGKS